MTRATVQGPSERFWGNGSYLTSLDDVPYFKGTRATAILDNRVFWKRSLNAYGKDYHMFCREKEEMEQEKRLRRIKSAPMSLDYISDSHSDSCHGNTEKSGKDQAYFQRSQSAMGYSLNENRASRLRQEYLQALRAMNVHSVLTKFDDYCPDVRPHRPSNSARYPRKLQAAKTWADPEWDASEYHVYVFNSRVDERWVESWVKNVLEARRYRVKINATKNDFVRFINDDSSRSKLVFILSPDLVRRKLKSFPLSELCQDVRRRSSVLVIKIRTCEIPDGLEFTNYMDLSVQKMDDLTLQTRLLPKLVSALQLPTSICS